ncbi:MAG: 3-phosphoshikimate 1-carboxyvinyltransferase [Gammaproteobacteria bacterium]|nr:MAG: 3-phosphoshikimate 1-carboxyvinyltransferase [Gammaproteobacteria bacterium]
MEQLTIAPIDHVRGTIRLPGSKSISNRALLLAALADGTTRLRNLMVGDDTRYMLDALAQLGVRTERDGKDVLIEGRGGPLSSADPVRTDQATDQRIELYLGMAGTAYRPLTAALCLGSGVFELTGNARMSERPIGDLVDALTALGGHIEYLGEPGFPPLRVTGGGLVGGEVTMPGHISSQFLTSLLMTAPYADAPVTVHIEGDQVSKPYLDITLAMMARFDIHASHESYQRFEVPVGHYTSPGTLLVEGDASAATYFLAAAAIRGGPLTIEGIGRNSIQGDFGFLDVLKTMGARVEIGDDYVRVTCGTLTGVDLDLNAIPDAAMTVAMLALFANGPTRIRNIYNWRVKETDRLSAMATELRKLGAAVEEGEDSLTVTPPASLKPARIDSYGDHRMAMCFSLAALGGVPITIDDPTCVSKTFPDYFDVLESVAQR